MAPLRAKGNNRCGGLMIDLSSRNIKHIADVTGFIKDNVEKALRLIGILEIVSSSIWKDKLVLKGGTPINIFYAHMPRLSVNIDLDYSVESKNKC